MKALKKSTDFPALESIRRDMDRFFDDLSPFSWKKENGGHKMELWAPDTDMSENDREYKVTVDLPGISKENIEVRCADNRLTISGTRDQEKEEKQENYLRRERYTGEFVRSYTLPAAVEEDRITARFRDGVLTVNVPKAEIKESKKVKIE